MSEDVCQSLLEVMTDAECDEADQWRGYPIGFTRVLRDQQLIGFHKGNIALPVHDESGQMVSVHVRMQDGNWFYTPPGHGAQLLVIGNPSNATTLYVLESQWDAFALMAAFNWHLDPSAWCDTAVVITRGASNCQKIKGLVHGNAAVIAIPQNDPPRADGRVPAAQTWLANVVSSVGRPVTVVKVPEDIKDLNDWLKAGATTDDINSAFASAITVNGAQSPGQEAIASCETDDQAPSSEAVAREFPISALPSPMREYVLAVAQCQRAPITLPACTALAVASACIGSGLEVQSAADRTTRGNIYIVTSAASGGNKSETFKHVAKPLLKHQAEAIDRWSREVEPDLKAELGILGKEIEAICKGAVKAKCEEERNALQKRLSKKIARKGQLEREANPPTYIAQDITTERLARLLEENGEVTFSASADARKLIDNLLGRYSGGKTSDEGIYLQAYSGDYCRVDRQKHKAITLNRPCLTLYWAIQPDLVCKMISEDSLREGGFLTRVLLCHTGAQPTKIIPNDQPIADAIRLPWEKRLAELIDTFRKRGATNIVKPTARAKQLLDEYYNTNVDRQLNDLRDVASFVSRWGEQAWRLAVVLHAMKWGSEAHAQAVEAETAEAAIQVAQWFADQQLGILAHSRLEKEKHTFEEVLELMRGRVESKGDEAISARDVHRAHIVSTPEEAKALLAKMETEEILVHTDQAPEHGGKTTRLYRWKEV